MESLANFFRGKRVLVTGHTGFKGAWLSLWLHQMGAQVTGYSLPAPQGELTFFQATGVQAGLQHIEGDIRDLNRVNAAVQDCQPEIAFHLAAQPLVRESFRNPVETYSTNVVGTAHVLDALRGCKATRSIVAVTTDKCYENRELAAGYTEDDRLGGHDPYSSSKACAELVASAYRDSYFNAQQVGLATARAGNVIGGGDWAAERLVPDFVRGIQSGQPLTIRSPNAIRPWQHVLEPLCGYMVLAKALWSQPEAFGCGWNFGPEAAAHITVLQLAEKLTSSWGQGSVEVNAPADSSMHETGVLALNCSKARNDLGWRPALAIDDTIRYTTDWYSGYYRNAASARSIAEAQIADYTRRFQLGGAGLSSAACGIAKERVA